MRSIRQHDAVESEIESTARWFENKQEGLAEKLILEYERALNRVVDQPFLCAKEEGSEARIRPLERFKSHGIVYTVDDSQIFIYALADLRRAPWRWRKRITPS